MAEALRSPGAAEDCREPLKLKNRRVATPRYEVQRRVGGVHRDLRRRGARVLSYMDDFLILTSTEEEACVQRDRVRRVLARLGLSRNENKGQWEPGQLIENLDLEVDLREGLFWVTETRINKIHAQAKSIISDATREKRRLSARRLAAFNGLCQSVYLAVPAARLYLRELYFVLTTKRSWGGEGEAYSSIPPRFGVVAPSAGDEPVELSKNMEESDEGKAPQLPTCLGWRPESQQGIEGLLAG
ncbi:hypothetical protein CYMTET_8443 [Cymbomonas tetramitiformis]|uniref:Reverse transcriptase domain-containing protein n=1 Tax=Cymbomonas tetramitiformis TaxID=36881 RepID=A0AAE0LFZ7_9CHLO|nr:hypothetical protein CYMTET_8443 [Cymbomonas tetramitiformis]